MKQTKLALSAVMIVAVGLIGTNFVTGSETTELETFGSNFESGAVYGHVTLVHSDPSGNILSYAQTDNLVANGGKDCMAEMIFGGTAGSACVGTLDSKYTTIALFDGETFPTTMNATTLKTVDVTTGGLEIIDGIAVPTQNVAASGAGYVDGAGSQSDIDKTFTAEGTQQVDGAALFNAATDSVLAGQTFTPVTLNNLDTLQVTWTITLG